MFFLLLLLPLLLRVPVHVTRSLVPRGESARLTFYLCQPHSGKLKLKNQKPKYQITHPSGKIANTDDVTLKLHYNVQPWVGLLTWNLPQDLFLWKTMSGGESDKITLPALKVKDAKDSKKDSKTKKTKKAKA